MSHIVVMSSQSFHFIIHLLNCGSIKCITVEDELSKSFSLKLVKVLAALARAVSNN